MTIVVPCVPAKAGIHLLSIPLDAAAGDRPLPTQGHICAKGGKCG